MNTLGLSKEELDVLKPLTTAIKIQDFLNTIPNNLAKKGSTLYSPRQVLKHHKAYCIEGAFLAATAFWLHGEEPLVMDLRARDDDYDHVVALYKKNGYWGAVSKTNHAPLRFRDPVYKTVRELAMSYFHEYFLFTTGEKTLLDYSQPIHLKRFGTKWVTSETGIEKIADMFDDLPHTRCFPSSQKRYIRKADPIERRASRIPEWSRRDPRT